MPRADCAKLLSLQPPSLEPVVQPAFENPSGLLSGDNRRSLVSHRIFLEIVSLQHLTTLSVHIFLTLPSFQREFVLSANAASDSAADAVLAGTTGACPAGSPRGARLSSCRRELIMEGGHEGPRSRNWKYDPLRV